ncbi:DUF6283 family protein [Ornithinimicrobium murale]|uniref:DUF6283 family protein n=1 Tax=Ornithinimicrobium murale TaxID=1050153 RepID=UPI000E0D9546|nr:DUF6283 family protein [Ornithinimicrobium murale]
MREPAKNPCGSCPYRRDVPSGVWDASEYAKLPAYDADTSNQPTGVFLCHQRSGAVCSGWAGCHDMDESLALRLAVAMGTLDATTARQVVDYVSPVPLFDTGAQAAEHGLAELTEPGEKAARTIGKLVRKGVAAAGWTPRHTSRL